MYADEFDFTAQQYSQFAADGEPESRPAIFAGRTGIRLLESFENQPLLLRRHADAGVRDRERDHLLAHG